MLLNIETFTDIDRYFTFYIYKRVSSPKITELRDHQKCELHNLQITFLIQQTFRLELYSGDFARSPCSLARNLYLSPGG